VANQATGGMLQRLNYSLSRPSSQESQSLRSLESEESLSNLKEEKEAQPYSREELEKELQKEVEHRLSKELQAQEARIADVVNLLQDKGPTAVQVDEGDSKLAPRRIFHKLEIETDTHPFFKRVWYIRHRLNANSPLLSKKARRMVAANNGFWPEELNNHESVREHVKFSEIICNFSGTANASGNVVFCQKVYDYVDVNVGYTFVTLLCMENGELISDIELINDVVEQNGGGAEPFRDTVASEEVAALIDAQRAERSAIRMHEAEKKVADEMPGVSLMDTLDVHEEIPESLSLELDLEAAEAGLVSEGKHKDS
jgi:hypothetical protein